MQSADRDQHVDRIFIHAAERQVSYAIMSIRSFNEALRQRQVEAMFLHLENFLNHVAKLSLIFWPERRGDASRGARLRKRFGIPDRHIIWDREARNDLQHFDERVDTWARSTLDGNFFFQVVADGPNAIVVNGKPPELFLGFNPVTKILTSQSKTFDIQAIANGVSEIGNLLNSKKQLMSA